MTFRIVMAARAGRDLERLPEKIATACVEFIYGGLADNPYRVGKPLFAELAGHYSARRGDYRIIYTINEDARAVEISRIAARSHAYRS